MKKLFKKLIKLIAAIFNRDPDKPSPLGPVPSWDKTTKASCWQGGDAEVRHMNILSPHMPEETFKARVKWAKDRKCNTVHQALQMLISELRRHDGDNAWERIPTEVP